jgi:prepilin-type N-terminal cleavage/methylation domain-containing protein
MTFARRKTVNSRRISAGYTLIEILVVVTILGIAGALVIPAMGQTGIIKIQGAVRQVVSDLTFAQADAVAFQERRAVVFDVARSSYAVVQVPGNTIDVAANILYDPTRPAGRYEIDFRDERYGDARITNVDFGSGSTALIFDGLGGPVESAASNNPSPGGTIRLQGAGNAFIISVEAFTGRITVRQDTTPTP